jgi:hypothetical protein
MYSDSLKKRVEVKNKKGVTMRTETKGLNKNGWALLIVGILSLLVGSVKAVRDGETSDSMKQLRIENTKAYSELKDSVTSTGLHQYKKDSTNFKHNFDKFLNVLRGRDSSRFMRLQKELGPKGYGLDQKWGVTTSKRAAEAPQMVFNGNFSNMSVSGNNMTHHYEFNLRKKK